MYLFCVCKIHVFSTISLRTVVICDLARLTASLPYCIRHKRVPIIVIVFSHMRPMFVISDLAMKFSVIFKGHVRQPEIDPFDLTGPKADYKRTSQEIKSSCKRKQ